MSSYGLANSQATTFRALGMQHRGFPARMDSPFYSTTGWPPSNSKRRHEGSSSGSSGSSSSTTASNAAVSALALLSFLFFLNMLQQNLAAGQQQTLLFMVNNSAGTTNASRLTNNRRGVRRPLIAVAQVQAKQGFNGRTRLTIKTMKNMKTRNRKRRPRDLSQDDPTLQDINKLDPQIMEEEEDIEDEEVEISNLDPSDELTVGEEEEEEAPPVMMPGIERAGALQLSAWLQGRLGADQMRYDLVDTLTNCRAVVACTLRRTSKKAPLLPTSGALPDESIRKLLGEAGEYAEVGHLDEACEDLLMAAGDECNELAKSFSNLLPALDKDHNPTIDHAGKTDEMAQKTDL